MCKLHIDNERDEDSDWAVLNAFYDTIDKKAIQDDEESIKYIDDSHYTSMKLKTFHYKRERHSRHAKKILKVSAMFERTEKSAAVSSDVSSDVQFEMQSAELSQQNVATWVCMLFDDSVIVKMLCCT